jgi:hypothetical protein
MDQFAKKRFSLLSAILVPELKVITVILMANGFYLNMTAKLKITHNFSDDLVAEGANDLKLVVTDNVEIQPLKHFFRSQKINIIHIVWAV